MDFQDEIVKEFLIESHENLDQLDRDLIALEETPNDHNRLSSIFRTIHTIKGTSGFLAFPTLEHVTHVGENLLVRVRDGELQLSPEMTNGLLGMVDAVRSILANIETSATEGGDSYDAVVQQLEYLKNQPASQITHPDKKGSSDEAPPIQLDQQLSHPDKSNVESGLCEGLRTSTQSSRGVIPFEFSDEEYSEGATANSAADSTVRIDVELLDRLMNLVGELVLARNQVLQLTHTIDDTAMTAAAQRLNLITTELQEGVMKTRMQPIKNVWSKLPRLVRDLSNTCGKKVQVRLEGADTELDKTILEAIRDPLTHIVRNSVDHGIEASSVRSALGKPEEGTLWLRAYHESGQVNIEVADDGNGVDVKRVRQKAVEKGLVTPETAAAMSDREAIQLILLPGFSTADSVTSVSGRGVGMDVVKTNVEKIGGSLDIQSVAGKGTTLRIKIPLTLAIIPVLVVSCSGDRYCIPQVSLQELVRLEGDRPQTDIEFLHSVPVYRLRGRLLPLVYLDEQLGLRRPRTNQERLLDEAVNIVVLRAEDREFGLVVDHINDTQEIVVKPLGKHIKSVQAFAGATIMGDGSVSLILDIPGVAQKAHVLSENADRKYRDTTQCQMDQVQAAESWLIVDPKDGTRVAIPLTAVARLEEINTRFIEKTGQCQVVQYRGEIMPLISINEYGQIEADDEGTVALVVFNDGQRNVGVVVGQILDIVHQSDVATGNYGDPGTRIIAGRVTRVLDLAQVAMQI